MRLVRKDKDKSDRIEDFRPISLLNTKVKFLDNVLAKFFACIAVGLMVEVHFCPSRQKHPGKSSPYTLHRIGFTKHFWQGRGSSPFKSS